MSLKYGLIPICFFVFCVSAASQNQDFAPTRLHEGPRYYFDIVTSASDDSGYVDVKFYTKVAFDELQFIRADDGAYRAGYELTLALLDGDGEQIDSRIEKKNVRAYAYEETNATDRFDLGETGFRLNPGAYKMTMRLMDEDSKLTSPHRLDLKLPDYWKRDLSMSDILLADTVWTDPSGRLKAVPNATWIFAMGQKQLYLVFDVYSDETWESIPLSMKLIVGKKTVRTVEDMVRRTGFRSPVVLRLPREELNPGQYRLEISVGKDNRIDGRIKNLTVRWLDMPIYTLDLDKSILQLKYIAKPDAMKKMKKAEGEEKRRLFLEYWKSVDPTPATEINELMDEYYLRVDFANRNFSTRTEGWNTDRGMVYILLGAPNDIERHPFEMDTKPYEVWTYYEISREFVFVDDTGFGDYRLVSPFWDYLSGP
jgi:GWxTD domain-containing protein